MMLMKIGRHETVDDPRLPLIPGTRQRRNTNKYRVLCGIPLPNADILEPLKSNDKLVDKRMRARNGQAAAVLIDGGHNAPAGHSPAIPGGGRR